MAPLQANSGGRGNDHRVGRQNPVYKEQCTSLESIHEVKKLSSIFCRLKDEEYSD